MKLVKKIDIEVEGDKLRLENVSIAGNEYDIEIINYNSFFTLKFIQGELEIFEITISNDGDIKLERLIRRMGHDHDDAEFFCSADIWAKGISSALKIPFGMRKVVEPHVYGY
ncbi:hypothetical protein LCGC14_1941220 [marine sediment metagenome]|uniref:Uncharacterized protein n=1 Tax=marine sediment metagenome TaxID=412755 RepID=A0A0F9IHJ3_9ZZZZ